MSFLRNSLLLILVSGLFVFAQSQGNFAAKLGLNFSGKGELTAEGESIDGDVSTGFEVDLEYHYRTSPQLIIGGGAGYLFERSGENAPETYSMIPVYALIKYEIQSEGSFIPGLEGRVGYSFLNFDSGDDNIKIDVTGGIHYGVALTGTYNKQYLIGIGYYVYNATGDYDAYGNTGSVDAKYSCITLSVGMSFGGK